MNKVQIHLGDPVIVSQGPTWDEVGWGPYQFPILSRLDDGTIVYNFNDCADSETAYNEVPKCMISHDDGATWQKANLCDYLGKMGILLPNGERLKPVGLEQISLDKIKLPKPIGENNRGHQVYRVADIPDGQCNKTWKFYRTPNGSETPVMEECKMNWPFMAARSFQGVFVLPAPRGLMHMGPDGTLWISHYDQCVCNPENGGFVPYSSTFLFRSVDMGHTWNLVSYHLYDPDTSRDPDAYYREGYDENDIAFTPDGSIVQVVRTCSNSPSWFFRSSDNGKSWDPVRMFDTKGVCPRLLALKCGVTLCSYGRPGVWVRATRDPSGREWDRPYEIVPPAKEGETNSCCYTFMVATSDHTALLAYSDFTVPDASGTPRKTMLIRKITIEE